LLIKSGVVGPFLNSLWVNHGLVYSWLNFWMSKAFAGRKLQLMLLFECRPTFFDFYNAIHLPVMNKAGAAEAKTSPSCQAFLNNNGDVRSY
jgi:hypothetical protein